MTKADKYITPCKHCRGRYEDHVGKKRKCPFDHTYYAADLLKLRLVLDVRVDEQKLIKYAHKRVKVAWGETLESLCMDDEDLVIRALFEALVASSEGKTQLYDMGIEEIGHRR